MSEISCLTDKPVTKVNGDQLDALNYANALCKFIKSASTPVTIGIQGGWGSGKTSLFSLMIRTLEPSDDQKSDTNTLCVTINAWEHSLFHDSNSKSSVVLSLLTGMIEAISSNAQEADFVKSADQKETSKFARAAVEIANGIRTYLPFMTSVAIKAATGVDITNPAKKNDDKSSDIVQIPQLAKQIHDLKDNLSNLVSTLKSNNGEQIKVVIFVDDLDRVPPPTAVEILDTLKNIFDIDNCIFVLAIDYEVVVRGLIEKFGERTAVNEREFRQYFDKIIQIPFTMPIGAYSQSMRHLLKDELIKLGMYKNDSSQDAQKESVALKTMVTVAKLATGGIPRSIKRILNTLSLLEYIGEAEEKCLNADQKLHRLTVRFIIVALHINFPEVCSRLMEACNFPKWDINELDMLWQLNYNTEDEKNKKALAAIAGNNLEAYFDESWEKVVFCLCSRSAWLKMKAPNVSKILNILRNVLNKQIDEKGRNISDSYEGLLSDDGLELLATLLKSINMVSIDSELDSVSETYRYDPVSRYCRKIHEELANGPMAGYIVPYDERLFAEQSGIDESGRIYTAKMQQDHLDNFIIEYNSDETQLTFAIKGDIPEEYRGENFDAIYERAAIDDEIGVYPSHAQYRLEFPIFKFTADDFNRAPSKVLPDAIKLFKETEKLANLLK